MVPGAIALMLMLYGAYSKAACRVKPRTPAFAAVYATCPIWPSNAATEEVMACRGYSADQRDVAAAEAHATGAAITGWRDRIRQRVENIGRRPSTGPKREGETQ